MKVTKFLNLLLVVLLVTLSSNGRVWAQGRSIPLVRDAEIEALVRDYTRPLLQAAGIKATIDVILVNDMSFNAFVDGQRIFVNIGALMQSATPNEIIGVLAHEIGHLAGGHQMRLREQLKRAQTMAVIGMLLGMGAGAAGAMAGNSDAGAAGAAVAAGSGEIALRSLLSYQRSEESAADRSAVTYLNRTQQSTKGILTTFERFSNALSLSGSRIDPYRQSHPLPRERIAALTTLARQSPYFDKKDPPALQLRHDMMRAKIAASTRRFAELRRMFAANPRGLPARYGEVIMAAQGAGNPKDAVVKARALVKEAPNNPYFIEILGDALLRANDARGAALAYKQAASLEKNRSSLLRIAYGRALLMSNDPGQIEAAVKEIKAGLLKEPNFASAYQLLAQAYGRLGKTALAELATADQHYYSGNYRQAQIFAARAQRSLKKDSAEWLRARDILSIAQKREQGTKR